MNNYSTKIAALVAGLTLSLGACTDDSEPTPQPGTTEAHHTIALGAGSTGESVTFVQSLEDFGADRSISFNAYGFEVPSTRTARIFQSTDGSNLYDLDYGGGRVYKFQVNGGESYTQLSEVNVEYAIGTANPRITPLNDEYAMLHYVQTENYVDETSGAVTMKQANASIVLLSLENLDMQTIEKFEIPTSGDNGLDYVGRIDAPVVVGDKLYYGLSRSGFDPNDPDSRTIVPNNTNVETMVLDFPSLTNPRIIGTTAGGAKGATNGYRTPVAHVDENDDIYQIVTTLDENDDTFILKISNGDYDDNYSFNLSELLGQRVRSYGWFYVGNGIGYVPYANLDIEGDNNYSVARVDVYNNKAVEMNVPDGLWLRQYQSGKMIDGKFHMALAPLGEGGNVYIFDPANETADGFTKGASLQTGADAFYIGIY
ncbi:hypothetical protein GCM10007049_11500 [Echinicola pacifica]|uniref:DUF4374 domain-containing protein n=1 Tax=Echinicola pacifica TaxID=346377 RepID=A0A918PRS7_9BACT|nr:hypothetical protein [Echinicola pacifica]GGZ20622.1 hypothetical protein GCM10007049_11500 [Echinicola pacifica]